ncbi:MAG: HAMP domain-containing protein, partial [Chloroflexales bacterium]|nr:HAMP domain-containing protein [Chloroflexales bacterium]
MRSLRAVAIVSHILPVLLVAPLVSLVLALLIETRILMPGLAASAAARVALLREAALVQPDIWGGGAVARRFVDDAAAAAGGAVLLLDRNLVILAQSGPEGEIVVAAPPTANATVQVRVRYGWASQQALAVAGVAPAGGSLLGYLAYSESGGGHASPFTTLRWLVGGVLLAQLALAGVAGALLALRLARPIAEAADALGAVAASQTQAPLVEGGPTEIRRLLAAVNRLAARLAGLEQQRRQAFANIVHELGRPLGAVRSAIYVLRGPTGADQKVRDELLAGIDDEITRMQPLLDDLTQLYAQVEGRSRPQC